MKVAHRLRIPVLAVGLAALACSTPAGDPQAPGGPLELVESVDLRRYQGRWYEIARLPNSFQDHCLGEVTADYTLRREGRVDVVNRCRIEAGTVDSAEGVARRPDPDRPGALEVRFAPSWLSWLPAVWGDYQIVALDDDYRWVMVGSPSREYLWILAREPRLHDARLQGLLAEAGRQGFPVDAVRRTRQEEP